MHRITLTAALLTALLVATALPGRAGEPRPISGAQLAALIDAGEPPVILDVRTPAEFSAGHIPGAINIPLQQLDARLGELGGLESSEIVLHCEAGPRAVRADQILAEHGFEAVRPLTGHMSAWRASGRRTTPPGCVTC